MKMLLIESQPGIAALLTDKLLAAGHDIVTCFDDETEGPCRSVYCNAECPLNTHVDLAVVARREGTAPTLDEMGGVCAARHRVPVVRIDPNRADAPERLIAAAAAGKDRAEAAYAAIVRTALSPTGTTVEAECEPGRVHVTLGLPVDATPSARWTLVDQARAAVRDYDRYVPVIDVSVASR